MSRTPRLIAGVVTDQGQQRSNNEDLPYVDEQEGIFAVVDGVGGEAAGEEAARTAVNAIHDRFEQPGGDTEERIREAIAHANNSIYESAQAHPERRGMACVLTLAVIEGRTVTVGHVGDSRLYRIRNGRMEKITPDHSPIGEREDRGELTEAEAMAHPRRNEVYRDVGSEPHQPDDPAFVDILRTSLPPDGALLICSDGLTDMLTRAQMLEIIQTYDGDPQRIARLLVDAANSAGGKDNITVIFVPGSDFSPANAHTITRQIERSPRATTTVQVPAPPPTSAPPLYTSAPRDHRDDPPVRHTSNAARWWIAIAMVLLLAAAALWAIRDRWIGSLHLGPATLRVGRTQHYPSISAALDAARDGDSVLVSPGVYSENVLLKSGVTLLSAQPRKAAIQASGTAIDAQSVTQARVSGFRILPDPTNSLQIGLRARDSVIQIDDSEISGASDDGVVIEGSTTASLSNNFIHANARAGVRIDSTTPPDMQGNRICDNGQDIVPPSALADAANVTGPCTAREPTREPAHPRRESPATDQESRATTEHESRSTAHRDSHSPAHRESRTK